MTITEKYWLTILLTICKYLIFVFFIGPAGFCWAGYYIDKMWYLGLIIWPLTIMLGCVNLRYIRFIYKDKDLNNLK